MVKLKIDYSTMSEERINKLIKETGYSRAFPVFGNIIENNPTYKVAWKHGSQKTILPPMDMGRNEIELAPGFMANAATYGVLRPGQQTNKLTPDQIRAAAAAAAAAAEAEAAALTPGNDGGKKARRSRKSRKSRKVRKSYKKYRKSRKVRKSRRARR
jgi:hypothetical protein